MRLVTHFSAFALLFTGGCSDVEVPAGCHTHGDVIHCDDSHGVITTVVLNFTPVDGGETLTFMASDPENDGDPIVDDIRLPDLGGYALDLEVWNELEDPVEDVTPEVDDLASEHQFFFTGSAVESPATGTNTLAVIEQTYADTDADGLPVGLANSVTTLGQGSGTFVVTLRHMPAENDTPVKTGGLAQIVATDGFGAIGGGSDAEVTFNLDVE